MLESRDRRRGRWGTGSHSVVMCVPPLQAAAFNAASFAGYGLVLLRGSAGGRGESSGAPLTDGGAGPAEGDIAVTLPLTDVVFGSAVAADGQPPILYTSVRVAAPAR